MTNAAKDPTFDSEQAKLLFECKLEIEHAWMDDSEPGAVHRLARAHPELAEDLYDFFAFMVETHATSDELRPEFAETNRKVRDVVRRKLAETGAEEPRTFLALLRDTSDESVDAIAASMNVTPEFLVVVSKHGPVLPSKAREELVRRARRTRDFDESEAVASFDAPPSLRRAASRNGAFTPASITYRDVVEHSSLNAEEKQFWLSLS